MIAQVLKHTYIFTVPHTKINVQKIKGKAIEMIGFDHRDNEITKLA